MPHEREALLVLVADGPPAAVDLEQHRGVVDLAGRLVDVEEPTPAVLRCVADVLRMPRSLSASTTALATAGVEAMVPASPAPLAPIGLTVVVVTVRSSS